MAAHISGEVNFDSFDGDRNNWTIEGFGPGTSPYSIHVTKIAERDVAPEARFDPNCNQECMDAISILSKALSTR